MGATSATDHGSALNPSGEINPARMEVRISADLNGRLANLASDLGPGTSTAEVVRRALALYLLAKQKESDGARLQFVKGSDTETVINI